MKPANSCAASFATVLQTDHAACYGRELLATLGYDGASLTVASDHPAVAWKRSRLFATTKLMLPSPLVAHVDGALMALRHLAPKAPLPESGALLMGERARLRETIREGRFCAGGYGRLLDARDGRIALNLVRDDDWALIPAWLEDYVEDWDGIIQAVKYKSVHYLVERASELGLAVAPDQLIPRPESWLRTQHFTSSTLKGRPLVVDLSGLWAGPLASSLLHMCGARVVKVEGPNRPDGMRNGHEGFYNLINAGKACVALDFKDDADLEFLKRLLTAADIVIEASRPRAFRQLGIVAEEFMTAKPGKIWARLTAYGREENRIGFGDDIGISAGLASLMERTHGEPCFVGDAIADPVNGVHLALAIWAVHLRGGGALIDLAMVDVLRYAMGDLPDDLAGTALAWQDIASRSGGKLYPMRKPHDEVQALGQSTDRIVAEL